MASAHTGSSAAGYCIDLVDKYNTGSILLSFFKKVADTGCTHTYKHFHKIRTGNREKRNSSFSGYCLGKKGFSCSRRAYKKKSLGDPGPHAGIFLRILQEINYFFQFFLLLLKSCYP